MQENKKKTLTILFIMIVIVAMSAVTYAFFMTGVNNNNAQEISVEAGTMKLTFSDADEGVSEHLKFGESVTKLFTLENTGTLEATANIYWNNLVNTYLPGSLVYKLEYTTSESEEKVVAIESQNVPRSEEPTQDILAYQQTVPSGVTYNYILTITLVHSDTVDQTRDLEAIFASGFTIQAVEKLDEPTLAAADTWYTQGGTTIARSSITSIDIVDSYDTTGKTIVDKWDASTEWDGSTTDDSGPVTAYLEYDGTGSTYKLTLAGNGYGKILANEDSSWVFSDSNRSDYFKNVTTINNANLLDSSKATTFERLFQSCEKLTTVDVSNWNTENVTNMFTTFSQCYKINNLEVSNWDTGKVTTMQAMFQLAFSIESLDLSNWDVSNVTNMMGMFQGHETLGAMSLKSIGDVGNWDTGKVEDMSYMFNQCKALTTLDVTNWETENVTNMGTMFQQCNSLTLLNTTNWDTGNVTDMQNMFYDCISLTELDTTNWNTANVTNMKYMFYNCTKLDSLDVSKWNTANVTNMYAMFAYTTALTTITEIENWTVNSTVDTTYMFYESGYTSYPSWYTA